LHFRFTCAAIGEISPPSFFYLKCDYIADNLSRLFRELIYFDKSSPRRVSPLSMMMRRDCLISRRITFRHADIDAERSLLGFYRA